MFIWSAFEGLIEITEAVLLLHHHPRNNLPFGGTTEIREARPWGTKEDKQRYLYLLQC